MAFVTTLPATSSDASVVKWSEPGLLVERWVWILLTLHCLDFVPTLLFSFFKDYFFPEDVSFPINNNQSRILLEVHYDNQAQRQDIVDSSGMELFYSTTRPVHLAGSLSISVPIIPLMIIPPGANRFSYTATCIPSCTEKVAKWTLYYFKLCVYLFQFQYIPEDGITVFGSFLHTHLIGMMAGFSIFKKWSVLSSITVGQALVVRHYRLTECNKYKEMEPIDRNLQYDFNYQVWTSFM